MEIYQILRKCIKVKFLNLFTTYNNKDGKPVPWSKYIEHNITMLIDKRQMYLISNFWFGFLFFVFLFLNIRSKKMMYDIDDAQLYLIFSYFVLCMFISLYVHIQRKRHLIMTGGFSFFLFSFFFFFFLFFFF